MSRLSRTIIGAAVMTATLALPTVAGAAGDDDHVVVGGDTLVDIAAEHGVPLTDLLAANGLSTASLIVPGQRLVVPGPAR